MRALQQNKLNIIRTAVCVSSEHQTSLARQCLSMSTSRPVWLPLQRRLTVQPASPKLSMQADDVSVSHATPVNSLHNPVMMKNLALTETNNLNTLLISENVKLVVHRHHQEPAALPLQSLQGELGSPSF